MTTFFRALLPMLVLFTLSGCDSKVATSETADTSSANTTSVSGEIVDLTGFVLTPSPGNNWQLAEKIDADGEVLISGYVDDKGLKQGSWTTWLEGRSPALVESFVNGQLHGARVQFDPVGRLRRMENYKMGVLHGRYAEYRAAIPQLTATYRDGEFDGTFRAHTLQNGKVNRTIEYKNGLQEGPMRWFNDSEELIQERMYKNGELVE